MKPWHISRPLVDFGMRQPVGVGDVTSGLLLVKLLQGATLQEATEHVTAAVYEIMVTTKAMQEYELQVVAAQIVLPIQNIISAQQSSETSHFGPQRPVGRWLLL